MTPKQAGALMRKTRYLIRRGEMTHRQGVLMSCLTFTCRPKGAGRVRVSYTRLEQLAHLSRDCVRTGIARLQQLGLIRKIKTRVLIPWGNATASRQATSIYVLNAAIDTEVGCRPVLREQGRKILTVSAKPVDNSPLERALAQLGRAIAGPEHAGPLLSPT